MNANKRVGEQVKQTQRHEAIVELVREHGYVSTEDLVAHFSVSPQTIRRDLNDLAAS
ncbi:MAG: DeoR family transcriptional regulator, partial [Plesiomonas shigelloides]